MIDEWVKLINPEHIVIDPTARIDAFVKISGGLGVVIGRHVHIASHCAINVGGGSVILRDHCGISAGVRITSGLPDLGYKYISAADPPALHRVRRYTTTLEAFAVAFANAVVGPGVTMGECSILAAASFARIDIPAWEIWGGAPARFLRRRDPAETIDQLQLEFGP